MVKRTVATLASTAVLALLITPSAQAAGPEKLSSYSGGSSATALVISLADQQIAFSATSAAVGSAGPDEATAGPMAAADGAALLVAGTPVPSGAPSQTPGGKANNSVAAVSLDLGDVTGGAADGLAAAVAQVTTTATVTDGAPAATSESGEVVLTLNGLSGTVLGPIVTPLEDALTDSLDQVNQGVLCGDQGALRVIGVCEAAAPVIDVGALVQEIIDELEGLDDQLVTLAQVRVGPSLSTSAANGADGVVTRAGSSAVFIELFPGLAAAIDEIVGELVPDAETDAPLLALQLGSATAEVVRDPVTGAPKAVAGAAQLLGVEVTDSLGILSDLVEVEVPNLLDTLAEAGAALSCDGGALADLICIDLGAVNELDDAELAARGYDYGKGTVGREATAASIAILPILGEVVGGNSVLGLQLSQASAAANAAIATPVAPPAPADPTPLPRTGGGANVPLALGLFAAAAAGLAVIRRSRTV